MSDSSAVARAPPQRKGPVGSSGAVRRRSTAAKGSGAPMGGSGNFLRLVTDDAPGLRVGPTAVLVLSLCFIGFVVMLHIWGKFQRNTSA